MHKLTVEPEGSMPVVPKPATGHGPLNLPSTLLLHNPIRLVFLNTLCYPNTTDSEAEDRGYNQQSNVDFALQFNNTDSPNHPFS